MSDLGIPSPLQLIIFGAAGDLTWRKIAPALYNLYCNKAFPEIFTITGIDVRDMEGSAFRERFKDGITQFSGQPEVNPQDWENFAQALKFMKADFNDPEIYRRLSELLVSSEKEWDARSVRIFYLAVPPVIVHSIAEHLGRSHLSHDHGRTRIVVEKPFGLNLESAGALNRILNRNFEESQIFRIDHYLGKETVQNILALRFANALFEPVWDRRYIDHVQITVAEQVGVEHRGSYYEHAGALRDMIQNHLLQILCFIAMEPPVSFGADEIRGKAVDVLHAIRPIPLDSVDKFAARGQYGGGWIEGEHVVPYRDESGVSMNSTTETYAALKLYIDNWRWQDVPFYLRTGKRLTQRVSTVFIQFRPVPHQSFPASAVLSWHPNRLMLKIQPDEGITLKFQAKRPGYPLRLSPVAMHFDYYDTFKIGPPEAYETLLLDIMAGDATLFKRIDQVEAAWQVVMPVLTSWENTIPEGFPNYMSGTWGPEEAQSIIAQDGRSWLQTGIEDIERPAHDDRQK